MNGEQSCPTFVRPMDPPGALPAKVAIYSGGLYCNRAIKRLWFVLTLLIVLINCRMADRVYINEDICGVSFV